MTSYRAAVFDLDGTLLDTLADLVESVNFALTECGCPTRSTEEIRRFLGNGMENLMTLCLPEDRRALVPDALRVFQEHYAVHSLDRTGPYAGIPELLARLNAAGVKVAMVSNKVDWAVKELRAHFFADAVPVAVGDLPGRRQRKPAPDSTLAALAEVGVSPEEAVFVGDSEVDVETARNAGMDCISVTWGFRDEPVLRRCGATRLTDDPAQVADWILGKDE